VDIFSLTTLFVGLTSVITGNIMHAAGS